jgi:hypothetical protein
MVNFQNRVNELALATGLQPSQVKNYFLTWHWSTAVKNCNDYEDYNTQLICISDYYNIA